MERPATLTLRIGDWSVNPAAGQISRDGSTVRVEVRTMRLLLCLADHAGEVVSIEDLLNQVWPDVAVTPDSVYQAVTSLRRLLGDDTRQPTYIATVPRLGYRMIATVSWLPRQSVAQTETSLSSPGEDATPAIGASQTPAPRRRVSTGLLWAAGGVVCLAVGVAVLVMLSHRSPGKNLPSTSAATASQPQRSIAVLPFLDLTQGMKEEEFADGMTEEMIDKLSKIPGLQVPSATSSFYFKGKQIPIPEIAKSLGVTYVLDGSVRKSGPMLRVAARLVRADTGYVVWSETYDRPFTDRLMVQDDIAGEVTKALNASSEFKAR
jgi:TolB-like protein/DNA-binding winged helix-turn-helix (wHTH) protein